MSISARVLRTLLFLFLGLCAIPLLAQQTGSISGKVTASDGSALPGVTIEASSDVLPKPRVTVSGANGEFRLRALLPGSYTLKFDLSGLQSVTRTAEVQLAQDTVADAALGMQATAEISVTAQVSLVDKETATVASGLSNQQIKALPVAQEYRDLQKLIPAVQYTEETTRGPSAGGSGQDNVYLFDGANVSLPLFGNLSAEPATHDIAQVTVIRGGARAVDFNRSGGFLIDSVSKSGSSAYHGQAGYQFQTEGMAAGLNSGSLSRYEQDRKWVDASVGGPILTDHLYFFGSYYRPEQDRQNRANLYGELPPYNSTRNEFYGKLTITPIQSALLNLSYRDSKRVDKSALFASNASATTGTGAESRLKIGTADGSWVINSRSFATFKYTHFENLTLELPDNISDAVFSSAIGTRLDVANLDKLGLLSVPGLVSGATAYNAFVQPLIDRYGYTLNGVKTGGGTVGFGSQFNEQDFFRDAAQIGYNLNLGTNVTHEIHVGYQWYSDRETLIRGSNGWGSISVPGGRLAPIPGTGQSAFYTATFQQQSTGAAAPIKSELRSQSFELNDTIRWNNLSINVGVLASNDTLYGQGLREDSSTLSGYVSAPGHKYKMYEIPFGKAIQPRVGVTWAYNGSDTVFASYAKYNPAPSSLPRAASWDRNLTGTFIDASFDQNGVLFAAVPRGSSSGKLFVQDMTPHRVDEFMAGTAKQVGSGLSARLYGRYRKGSHFWEDTNNNARVLFNPPAGIPRELYISDLAARTAQIGSGSSYVIADLDGGYSKYYEGTLEAEWRDAKTFVRGSYTYMHYYGNFDQDDTTGGSNDFNTFIGSSNIADGAGRQLWNFKDGTLHGDRPHMLKIYGARQLPWKGSFGLFFVAQSGQPWETNSYEPYRSLTTSTSDSNRFAEPAGSRRSAFHWQVDLNYTQNIPLSGQYAFQIAVDLFNVFNEQTGYNIEPQAHNSNFGNPRSYFNPRRVQLAARFLF
ncbi:MAG: carboxypeptidase regulatory-like domain-containing protein [Thermoanaerobaculia bacterium]